MEVKVLAFVGEQATRFWIPSEGIDVAIVATVEDEDWSGIPQGEIDEVEIFLRDLQLQMSGHPPVAGFFERLAHLNVGPIRAFVSGPCSEQDLNEVIREFFDKTNGSSSWQEHFDILC